MISILKIETEDSANGPGVRTSIFTAGCDLHCPGCFNPESWPLDTGEVVSEDSIIRAVHHDVLSTGVSWLGGEPILQWEALLPIVKQLHEEHYHQMLFTGRTLAQLQEIARRDYMFNYFIHCFDLLKCGPFVQKLFQPDLRFRGSTNQKIYEVDTHDLEHFEPKDISAVVDANIQYLIH